MESGVSSPRRYRGVTASERRAERRERLLAAGLEAFATHGYANASIRSISETASLNSRYFYEAFSSREDLLYHVYLRILGDITTEATAAVGAAESIDGKAHAGLRAGWTVLTEDPRKARIVALEVIGVSERLEQLRRDMRHALADLILKQALSLAGDDADLRIDPVLTARSLMGGVVEILGDWIHGDIDQSVDEIVNHFTRLFTAATFAAVERPVPSDATRRTRRDPRQDDHE